MSDLRQRLLERMAALKIVDCHSHTELQSVYYQSQRDLFAMRSHFNREIQGQVGCEGIEYEDVYAGCASDEERWALLRSVIDRAGNTSYWRHNLVTYQRLFGLEDDELTDDNWRSVNETIVRKTADPDWYRWVTEDLCGLRTQVLNVPFYASWEPRFFTSVLRMEPLLEMLDPAVRQRFAEETSEDLDSLDRFKNAVVSFTQGYNARGNRGIKLAHAYSRTLLTEDVPESEAAAIYSRVLMGAEPTPAEVGRFQDHMIRFLAGMAGEMHLVFQIHTGVQTNGGWIPDSNPMHLLELIQAYPGTTFDLFHMGYPYARELGMMGKHCANVYLNMAWAYVISMAASRQILSEWIDLVPGARLLAFGSDVHWPEFIYGHLEMARSCVADVLEGKVRRDYLSESAAGELLDQIWHDNAVALYRLDAPEHNAEA